MSRSPGYLPDAHLTGVLICRLSRQGGRNEILENDEIFRLCSAGAGYRHGVGWRGGASAARAVPAARHAVDGRRQAGRAHAREGGGVREPLRRGRRDLAGGGRGAGQPLDGRVPPRACRARGAGRAPRLQGPPHGGLPRPVVGGGHHARAPRERVAEEAQRRDGAAGASAGQRDERGRDRGALPRARRGRGVPRDHPDVQRQEPAAVRRLDRGFLVIDGHQDRRG